MLSPCRHTLTLSAKPDACFVAAVQSDEVTAEEMEAYRMTKARAEDPMNAFKQQPVVADGYDLV